MAHPVTTPEPVTLTLRPHLIEKGDVLVQEHGVDLTVASRPVVRHSSVSLVLHDRGCQYLRQYARAELLTIRRTA